MSRLTDVSPAARIGRGCDLGSFSVIHADVVLGDGCVVGPHCELGVPTPRAGGRPLVIGDGAVVRGRTTLYAGSTFGPGLRTGHGAVARENCEVGLEFQLGTSAMLDGDLSIGDYVKAHSGVTIAEHSRIGDFAYLLPRVQFLNDPIPPSPVILGVTVGELAVLAAAAVLYPGVSVGAGAFVAGGAHVKRDVPAVTVVAGDPARTVCALDRFVIPRHGAFHPWIERHRAKYPSGAQPRIDAALARLAVLLARASEGDA